MKNKLSKILSLGMSLILSISSVGLVKASDPKVSKYQGSTLPEPYLLHALQFFKNREDVQNFTLVNSKLQDVADMSLVCPIVNPTKKDFALFSNAKTIILDLYGPNFGAKWTAELEKLCRDIDNIWLISPTNKFILNSVLYSSPHNTTKITKFISNKQFDFLSRIKIFFKLPNLAELIVYDDGRFFEDMEDSVKVNKRIKKVIEKSKRTKITFVLHKDSYLDKQIREGLKDKENIELKYFERKLNFKPHQILHGIKPGRLAN